MGALAALALDDARRLSISADVIGAMSLEAMLGTAAAFEPALIKGAPHPGQVSPHVLAGSEIGASRAAEDPRGGQAPTRCAACSRSMGPPATRSTSWSACERQMNLETDNPLVLGHPADAIIEDERDRAVCVCVCDYLHWYWFSGIG